MKKQFTTLFALAASLFLLSGCNNSQSNTNHNQQIYTKIMAQGDHAVKKHDYAQAQAYYQAALKARPDDSKAQTYAQQAQNLTSAQKAVKNYSFAQAQNNLADVQDNSKGSASMKNTATKMLQTIKTVQKNRTQYRHRIETAATANDDHNYAQAQKQAIALMEITEFHKKYYGDLFKQANEILLTSSKNLQTTTANSAESKADTDTAHNNGQANDSHQAIGESDAIKNPTANGKKITAADIQKARKQLRDQGTQDAAASDSDIIRAIQKAATSGRSTITPADAGF